MSLLTLYPRWSDLRRRMSRAGELMRGVTRAAAARAPVVGTGRVRPPEPQSWTPAARPDASARAAFEERVAAANLRLMPYPFANALAIVTDLDAAERNDYTAYRGQLVDELGLDFGDSAFLHCTGGLYPRNVRAVREMALSFFRYDGDVNDLSSKTRDLNSNFTFLEVLREYHLGNISHLHSYGALGPRLVALGAASEIAQTGARFPCPQKATRVVGFAVRQVVCLAVVIHLAPSLARRVRAVEILGEDGAAVGRYRLLPLPADGWQPELGVPGGGRQAFWFEFDPTSAGDVAPMHSLARTLDIRFEPGAVEKDMVGEAFIVGVHRLTLKRMLDRLDRDFNVHFNTLVDHNASSFIAPSTEGFRRGMNLDALEAGGPASHYGRVREDRLSFSTLADDPAATAYVGDFIHDRFGIVYINPGGWSGEQVELDLNTLLFPVQTRDGHGVHLARRVIPQLQRADRASAELKSDMGTQSFPSRLATALDEAETADGRVWPIYTHLGNVRPKDQRRDPYLDWQPLHRAQALHYGFGAGGPGAPRLWLTQATTLYHYAAMMQGAAGHVAPGETEDCVVISPWDDPVTGQRFGETPDSLHGLTLYVPDRDRARLFLGGTEIDAFTRNPPDGAGRASVTVVGMAARHVLFDEIAPQVVADEAATASSAWVEADDSHSGRHHLSLTLDRDGSAGFSIPLAPFHPAAAQYLSYALRMSEGLDGATVGLITADGGTFQFAHGRGAGGPPVTATYRCADAPAGAWRRHIVPFYGLDWNDDAAPGGPLPNRRLRALTVRIAGRAGARLDLDCVSLIRPRGWRRPAPKAGFVFGGEVRAADGSAAAGATVRLAARPLTGATAGPARETVTDEAGLFAFTGLPAPAILEVSVLSGDGAPALAPRTFELHGDSFSAILAAPTEHA